jgi:hypothetical protein
VSYTSAVQRTIDLDRINALPRRVLVPAECERWAAEFTRVLRASPRVRAQLRPEQGIALIEALHCGGAFLGLPVGFGKTLISYCAALVFEAKRPILVLPASLRDKTWADFGAYAGVWRPLAHPFRLVSREELALAKNASLLQEHAPDLVVVYESDDHSHAQRGAPARLIRFKRKHPDVPFVCMTATPERLSIQDFAHLLWLALGPGAPVPSHEAELDLWAQVIDLKTRDPRRPDPGPLGATRGAAVEWFSRRLRETPGVILVDGDSCDAPLTIRWRFADEDPKLDAHFKEFAKREKNPRGIVVSDPLSRLTLENQMGCGLCSYYDPEPPEEWREARRAFAKFVRDHVAWSRRSRNPLDTEWQIVQHYPEANAVCTWLSTRGMFEPAKHTRFEWLSTSAVKSAAAWVAESAKPGIVWCGSVEFARALSRLTGLHYYGSLGRCASGGGLHEAPRDRSIIVSWQANKRGHNLQPWTRQLVCMPPQSARYLEQMFGRSHRSGQDEHVVIDILITCGATIDAFESAVSEAKFARDVTTLTQKILRAEIVRGKPPKTATNTYRWASRSMSGTK